MSAPDPLPLNELERRVRSMRPLDRRIFVAMRLDELSYAQIARITGLSVGQVERRFARALGVLNRDARPRPWWARAYASLCSAFSRR